MDHLCVCKSGPYLWIFLKEGSPEAVTDRSDTCRIGTGIVSSPLAEQRLSGRRVNVRSGQGGDNAGTRQFRLGQQLVIQPATDGYCFRRILPHFYKFRPQSQIISQI